MNTRISDHSVTMTISGVGTFYGEVGAAGVVRLKATSTQAANYVADAYTGNGKAAQWRDAIAAAAADEWRRRGNGILTVLWE